MTDPVPNLHAMCPSCREPMAVTPSEVQRYASTTWVGECCGGQPEVHRTFPSLAALEEERMLTQVVIDESDHRHAYSWRPESDDWRCSCGEDIDDAVGFWHEDEGVYLVLRLREWLGMTDEQYELMVGPMPEQLVVWTHEELGGLHD